jgi:uncharacterized protein
MSRPSPFSERGFGKRVLSVLTGALLLGLALAMPCAALAQGRPLDAPRAAGIVGERYDGYAEVRGAAPPDIVALVNQTNAERRALYEQRAKSEGAPLDAIGRIYAAQIMQSAPPGTWFLGQNGQWTRK